MSARTLIPHLAALAAVAGFIALMLWQFDRAEQKRRVLDNWNREQAIALDDIEQVPELPQPVFGLGFFEPERQILLDNKIRDGRSGVHVLTPWHTSDNRIFLVNRGWAHWPSRDRGLPDPDAPEDRLEIRGMLNEPPGVGLELGDSIKLDSRQWPQLMTYFNHQRLTAAFGPKLQRQIIQLDPSHPAHLTGDEWKVVTFGPDRHTGYAFTWGTIALVVAGIWLVLSFRSHRARRQ
ncbi:MAG: SURF1 family protein [Wenzhouxiangellaceae bacterium]|nr:SURF1 family protein [Wenzhouxiangellaceae bacterium]